MLSASYLQGLDTVEFTIPGIYYVRHSRRPDSFRILSTHRDGTRNKGQLFAQLAADGQIEKPGTWEFHHVVEGQHFADIDHLGQLPGIYKDGLPCVLLAQEEHRAYNSLLHSGAADELFRSSSPHIPLARTSSPALQSGTRSRSDAFRLRIDDLRLMYRSAYDGDLVLQTIASNVLDLTATTLS